MPDLRGSRIGPCLLRLRQPASPAGPMHHVEGGVGQAGSAADCGRLLRRRGLPGVLMEPPDADLPGGGTRAARIVHGLRPPDAGWPDIRIGLLVAAAVLAVVSRGDAFVLAVLLAAAIPGSVGGAAAALAIAGLVARVGSSSLAAATGAQVVLGPFAFVGPGPAALWAWCAAAALVLAALPGLAA